MELLCWPVASRFDEGVYHFFFRYGIGGSLLYQFLALAVPVCCILEDKIVVGFSDSGWLGNLFRFLHGSSLVRLERFSHVVCLSGCFWRCLLFPMEFLDGACSHFIISPTPV